MTEKTKAKSKAKPKNLIKESETVVIMRSQVNFNPKNVKHHTEDDIKQQKKNFKEVGYLGGIIWNAVTGNLVSGHKRLMTLDVMHEYPEKGDYEVKVEKCELTPKQELEQLIYMDSRSTNTAQDYSLIAEILPEIDYKLAGLDQNELSLVALESPFTEVSRDTIDRASGAEADLKKLAKPVEERKAEIKKVKEQLKKGLAMSQGASYVTLSFDSYAHKCMFLETYGYNPELIMLKGEQFMDMLAERPEE